MWLRSGRFSSRAKIRAPDLGRLGFDSLITIGFLPSYSLMLILISVHVAAMEFRGGRPYVSQDTRGRGWEPTLPELTPTRDSLPFDQRRACSIREAREASGISRSKLYELMAENLLETTTVGCRRLVVVASL
jgi:hypothetical protein